MKLRLDTKTVGALALGKGQRELFAWDSELAGFGLRLQGRRRTYVAQYRAGGRTRTVSRRSTLFQFSCCATSTAGCLIRTRSRAFGSLPARRSAATFEGLGRCATLTPWVSAARLIRSRRARTRPSRKLLRHRAAGSGTRRRPDRTSTTSG